MKTMQNPSRPDPEGWLICPHCQTRYQEPTIVPEHGATCPYCGLSLEQSPEPSMEELDGIFRGILDPSTSPAERYRLVTELSRRLLVEGRYDLRPIVDEFKP